MNQTRLWIFISLMLATCGSFAQLCEQRPNDSSIEPLASREECTAERLKLDRATTSPCSESSLLGAVEARNAEGVDRGVIGTVIIGFLALCFVRRRQTRAITRRGRSGPVRFSGTSKPGTRWRSASADLASSTPKRYCDPRSATPAAERNNTVFMGCRRPGIEVRATTNNRRDINHATDHQRATCRIADHAAR